MNASRIAPPLLLALAPARAGADRLGTSNTAPWQSSAAASHLHPMSLMLPTVSGPPEAVELFRRGQRYQALGAVLLAASIGFAVTGGATVVLERGDRSAIDQCVVDSPDCAAARSRRSLHVGAGIASFALAASTLIAGSISLGIGTHFVRRAKGMNLGIPVAPLPGPAGFGGGRLALALRFRI